MELSKDEMFEYHKNWARAERNKLLKETDWTQLNDCELSPEEIQEYNEYRQAVRQVVRDITDTSPITWPIKPE